MTTPKKPADRGVHHPDPRHAATDPAAAAQQDRTKADHDALEQSARRVESSAPSNVRDTNPQRAATDPVAAAQQDKVHADHDAMQRSAQRIEASVPADVRTTPVQHTATPAGGVDEARRNADIARDSVRRVEESLKDDDRDRR